MKLKYFVPAGTPPTETAVKSTRRLEFRPMKSAMTEKGSVVRGWLIKEIEIEPDDAKRGQQNDCEATSSHAVV